LLDAQYTVSKINERLKIAPTKPLGGEVQIPWLCENALGFTAIYTDTIWGEPSR